MRRLLYKLDELHWKLFGFWFTSPKNKLYVFLRGIYRALRNTGLRVMGLMGWVSIRQYEVAQYEIQVLEQRIQSISKTHPTVVEDK